MAQQYFKSRYNWPTQEAWEEYIRSGVRMPPTPQGTIAYNVRHWMWVCGYTQSDLADKMGVHRSQVSRILNSDDDHITFGTIRKLAAALEPIGPWPFLLCMAGHDKDNYESSAIIRFVHRWCGARSRQYQMSRALELLNKAEDEFFDGLDPGKNDIKLRITKTINGK